MNDQICNLLNCLMESNAEIRDALQREFGRGAGSSLAHSPEGKEAAYYLQADASASNIKQYTGSGEMRSSSNILDLTTGLGGKPATRGYIVAQNYLEDGSAAAGGCLIELYRSKDDLDRNEPAIGLQFGEGFAHGLTADYTHAKITPRHGTARIMVYVQ